MKFSQIVETLGKIAEKNSLISLPDCNPTLSGVAAVDAATGDQISYIEGGKFAKQVKTTQASVLIVPLDESLQQQASDRGIAWIATSNPRLVFAQIIDLFYQPFKPSPAIHPTAIIDPSAVIGNEVYIGPHVVIYGDVKIGDGVCIFPNVVIYPQVSIGDNTLLHANVTIQERSHIGADCVIHSGVVIGAEGFGFVPIAQGWYKMQQSGYVVLEDGVEIGCNSAIDRPSVGETRIGRNTKIDNLVQIGHGCEIGENCAIAGQVGLAGGVKLGNRVLLGGQVGIANQAHIGDGVIATAQTGIQGDVAPQEMVSGSPAIPHKLFLKIASIYKRLPDIYQFFRDSKK